MKCSVCYREDKKTTKVGANHMCRYCSSIFRNKTYSDFMSYRKMMMERKKRDNRNKKLEEIGI